MNFAKLKTLVDKNNVTNVMKIDKHKIKVTYKYGNQTLTSEIVYDQYKSEEELAAVINTDFERITQGKINTLLS